MGIETLNYTLLALSTMLFIVAVTRLHNPRAMDLVFATTAIPAFLLYSVFFLIADYFTGKGVDASVVFHIEYGLEGAGFGEYGFLIGLAIAGVIITVVLSWFLVRRLARRRKGEGPSKNRSFYLLILLSFAVNPVSYGLGQHLADTSSLLTNPDSEEFYRYYRSPVVRKMGDRQRNLVVIYAESLERSYFNESVFPGLAERLKRIEKNSTSFTDIRQIHGTYWTIAGITASQCGIPLVTPSHGNSMTGAERFLPRADCLGDRMSELGYQFHYLSGSSLSFAGTGKFFETHGYSKVTGLDELSSRIPVDVNENGWGYFDDVLLDVAFQEISGLASSGEPYAYFISTMDTHHPGENLSRSCDGIVFGAGDNSMLNAVECADYVIGRFIEKIRASEFGEDVVIVLASDHLAMRNSASEQLNQTERRNLLLINEPEGSGQVVTDPGSMLDFSPSLAPFLGFEANMGLGRNLLEEESLLTQIAGFNTKLKSWDAIVSDFWGFPVLAARGSIEVDPGEKLVHLTGRSYRYPLLVEISENLETTMRFDLDESGGRLTDYIEGMEPGKPFFWVHHCSKMGSLSLSHWGFETCVMGGRLGADPVFQGVVKENVRFDVASIMKEGRMRMERRSEAEIAEQAADPARFIAHAGGEVDGQKYTNSLEALDLHYGEGFRLFELDIIETSDKVFVAGHDWEHWRKLTDFPGDLPPSQAEFLQQKILGRYTPMDIERINEWFTKHPDAILVTDKINRPLDFSNRFVDKDRLMMELFSIDAIKEGKAAGILSPMMTGGLLAGLGNDKVKTLRFLGVTDVALSRRVINANIGLLADLRDAAIRVFVFHVGHGRNSDERHVVCRDLDSVFGLYADRWSFETPLDCSLTP